MPYVAPAESKYAQANDDAQVAFVNEEYRRRQTERRPFELSWRLNLAFIEGNQYLDINTQAGELIEIPKALWWQEREVFNHIGPIIETRISRLSRLHPILKCRPGTGDQSDIRAAKVGTCILKNIHDDKNIQNKNAEAANWAEACGSVFFKNVWNPDMGPVMARMEGEPIEAGQQGGTQDVREGDIDVIVVPPQEIFPDSCFRQNIENCRSIIHARAYHIADIEETWGVEVPPEAVSVMQLHRIMHGLGGLGYGGGGFYHTVAPLKEYALVKEFWERPTKKYPEGRLIIIAGGKLLHSGKLPFLVGEDGKPDLPFTKYDCIERPGVFWGRCVTERLIPVQRRYNALRNRKAEFLNRAAIGQWNVEEESVDLDNFENEAGAPGSVHVYKRGYTKPEMVQTPALPHDFVTEESTLLQEFSQISGVSELSRQSKADPGVKSGVALQIALEQDDTRLTQTVANISQFAVDNGKMWLRLYKQFAEGPRILRNVGKNNVVEVIDWSGADIRSDDVMVEPYSALSESPAQRRQMIFDFLQAGLFNDAEGSPLSKEMRAKIFEMVELGNWESGDDNDEIHLSKAERENHALTQGGMPMAVDYDDHILHIARHNNYRLTAEYEALLQQDPMLESRFDMHLQQHIMLMANVAMAGGGMGQPGMIPGLPGELPPEGLPQAPMPAENTPPMAPV